RQAKGRRGVACDAWRPRWQRRGQRPNVERKRRANELDSHAVATSASASRSCWAACSLRYCGSSFLMCCHYDTRPLKQVSSGKGGWCTELHREPAEGDGYNRNSSRVSSSRRAAHWLVTTRRPCIH